MSYRVIHNSENMYTILEKDTDIEVMEYRDEKSARSLCRSLNLGSGFDGLTPPFFDVRLYKQKERPSTE